MMISFFPPKSFTQHFGACLGYLAQNNGLLSRAQMMMSLLQIFWKCYEYGDNLVNVFEFIDDQRSKSVRDITIPDPEVTEEFIDKHGSIVRSEVKFSYKFEYPRNKS